jgi:hypothetical protein
MTATTTNGTSGAVPPDPKIIDILRSKKSGDDDDNKPFVSLEYFPPRSQEGVTVSACDACMHIHAFV